MLLVTSIKEFYIKGVGYYINGDGKYLRLSSENLFIQEFTEHNVRKKGSNRQKINEHLNTNC